MATLVLSSEPPRFRSCSTGSRAADSWVMPASDRPSLKASRTNPDLAGGDITLSLGNSEAWKDLDNIAALGLSLNAEGDNEPTERSSRASYSRTRFSEESTRLERTVSADPAVMERQLQRRRVIEELISTEESYIGDIKFLMNVYVTILASLPTQHQGLRSSINRNLTDIVELHEGILGELHRVVPNSEYTQLQQIQPAHKPPPRPNHQRWYSLDSVPEVKDGTPWLRDIPGMVAEPTVAADVAQVFGDRMYRFFVYEEYGAKYEMMIKDVASTHRAMPQWETYQKGLEALAASLGSANHHVDRSRKSLTIGDLLVKPIQRICRYPLLFAELLKHTPVYDCPNSHAQIEDVLVRLREATAEINRATDDPSVKVTLEKTWLLQDRLMFPDQSFDTNTKANVRLLGQIQLCGALHVCWQTRKGVKGQYMICLLYRDSLCLATAEGLHQVYVIQACIGLNTIKLEEADNCRGLQCHTAPFSWKLVFEIDHQLYEIIMTACTPKEEMEWRTRLTGLIPNEPHDHPEAPLCSSLSLDIKSLGTVFGKPDPSTAGAVSPINRSQSLLTTNSRIPVLSPGRGERARLEALLADVWSRSALPFPGITNRSKSEYLVRSSASAMKRKLSVASITNTFLKRTPSTTSVGQAREKLVADRSTDRDYHPTEESSGQARNTAGSPTLDWSPPRDLRRSGTGQQLEPELLGLRRRFCPWHGQENGAAAAASASTAAARGGDGAGDTSVDKAAVGIAGEQSAAESYKYAVGQVAVTCFNGQEKGERATPCGTRSRNPPTRSRAGADSQNRKQVD
ncbi:RhoGEF domain-containing protein [Apiospora kogelbergensis]|uniref:RhoGEF domain-containing protein n=1 Tax=Apiospora kogelbergensis TaxID=1337665 RepID=A0AAW0QVU9_9PEZI